MLIEVIFTHLIGTLGDDAKASNYAHDALQACDIKDKKLLSITAFKSLVVKIKSSEAFPPGQK